ncbi:bifunctional diaminohydroxyphosphoribosylaminopyrimidine deaminase/5-amino-6-(5-phosphoribosylamino)uracil reductase RibD [Ferruginibacter yonginensis]|uniref:Riboflavin biosynthesis protein RibD n=1 Tax=Ferruginibacter yonginensis TaxID=1310416 RepID=A0ABV8QV82_9BACT
MQRCIQLALKGAGYVAPNPMVGAVLVYNDTIIGEGYHQQFGQAHAEVNCINAVPEQLQHLISSSILYVSLEPCAHYGKTPPCVDLILQRQIKKVVVGCTDSFEKVNGAGIQKLQAAGVAVVVGVLESACVTLNKRFFTFHQKKRPFVLLKWAQSNDGFIAGDGGIPIHISNEYSNRLVHQLRATEAAILVGSTTVINDNPQLNTRKWIGKHPTRLIIDPQLKIGNDAHIYDGTTPTIIFNKIKNDYQLNVQWVKVDADQNYMDSVFTFCYQQQLNSIIIEGGSKTLQSFIDAGMWDEAIVITNTHLQIHRGITSPILKNHQLVNIQTIQTDNICYYSNLNNELL